MIKQALTLIVKHASKSLAPKALPKPRFIAKNICLFSENK